MIRHPSTSSRKDDSKTDRSVSCVWLFYRNCTACANSNYIPVHLCALQSLLSMHCPVCITALSSMHCPVCISLVVYALPCVHQSCCLCIALCALQPCRLCIAYQSNRIDYFIKFVHIKINRCKLYDITLLIIIDFSLFYNSALKIF